VCGSKLIEVGYPDEAGFQSYRCPNDCKFEQPLSWKVWNAIGVTILLLLMILAIVFTSPFIIVDKIDSAISAFRGVQH